MGDSLTPADEGLPIPPPVTLTSHQTKRGPPPIAPPPSIRGDLFINNPTPGRPAGSSLVPRHRRRWGLRIPSVIPARNATGSPTALQLPPLACQDHSISNSVSWSLGLRQGPASAPNDSQLRGHWERLNSICSPSNEIRGAGFFIFSKVCHGQDE